MGQIAEQLQGHQKGKLPSQPEQAMAITIHQESRESKGNDNGVEEIPVDDMPLHSKTKGEDMEEPQEDILEPIQPKTDKVRKPLSLPSLDKEANPCKLPIPLKCHPKKVGNDKKPLKMKDS